MAQKVAPAEKCQEHAGSQKVDGQEMNDIEKRRRLELHGGKDGKRIPGC